MFIAMPVCRSWSCASLALLIKLDPSRTIYTVSGLCASMSITHGVLLEQHQYKGDYASFMTTSRNAMHTVAIRRHSRFNVAN